MLRRIARALRASLLVLGTVLTLWIPASWLWHATADVESYRIAVIDGSLKIARVQMGTGWPASLGIRYWRETEVFSLPLAPLCLLCLAWPVTSFIIARRRRKGRGFEVEARPGAAVPPPESEAPKGHQQREPGASPRVGEGRDP